MKLHLGELRPARLCRSLNSPFAFDTRPRVYGHGLILYMRSLLSYSSTRPIGGKAQIFEDAPAVPGEALGSTRLDLCAALLS